MRGMGLVRGAALAAAVLLPAERAAAQAEYAFWYADVFKHPFGQPAEAFEARGELATVIEVRGSAPNSFDLRGTLKVTMPEVLPVGNMSKPKVVVTLNAQVTLAKGAQIENVSISVNANGTPKSQGLKTEFGVAKTYTLSLELPLEVDINGTPEKRMKDQEGKEYIVREVPIGFGVSAGQAGSSARVMYFYTRQ